MAEPLAGRPIAPAVYRFPDQPQAWLPWQRTEERLKQARFYWIVTASPKAVPHATPLWGVFVEGDLYVNGLPGTRWARNLVANPTVSVHLDGGDDVVIIEGRAADVTTDPQLGERIVAEWLRKYGRLEPEPVHDGIFRIRPRTARAWSTESLTDGTRWVLP